MSKKVRVAIIGLGFGSEFIPIYQAHPDAEMYAINRRDKAGLDACGDQFGIKARYTDLKRGKANWHDGRILLDFKDADGNKLKGGAKAQAFTGSSKGWVSKTIEFAVPEGAKTLEVMPALFMIAGGQLDLDDLELTVITDAEKIAALQKAAIPPGPWATPPIVATVVTPPADKQPKELKVVGKQLQTVDGKDVWLQGVAIPSMEWSAKGEHILESVKVAIDDWHANVIRLPIREHFWFGYGPYQNPKDKGAAYRALVADVVNTASARGAYVVIDFHQYRAPKAEFAGFWTDVAGHFKDNPAVIFELMNEPHSISWDIWQNGGKVYDKKKPAPAKPGDAKPDPAKPDAALDENQQSGPGFDSIGMQKLLDAIRATGAKNVVIAGGLDWGYDLSGILDGHALSDKTGNGIIYSSHVYPWKSGWQKKFLDIAEKYPVFIGECGGEVERLSFIPPERHEDPYKWCPDMLGTIQKHKLHWTAWSFHPKAAPKVLLDWSYAPTPYWGEFVKKALSGTQYEAKKLR